MRLTIGVQPRSKKASVGGSRDGALVVRVTEPAVDGRATEAALRAVASALGAARRDVRLVSGETSRTKIIDVDGIDEATLTTRLAALLSPP